MSVVRSMGWGSAPGIKVSNLLRTTPEMNINFSRARMMAADGRCKTFDASADGYGRGEGAGMVLLMAVAIRPAPRAVGVAAAFWHMVDLVWVLLFPLVYVLR